MSRAILLFLFLKIKMKLIYSPGWLRNCYKLMARLLGSLKRKWFDSVLSLLIISAVGRGVCSVPARRW